MLKPVDPALFLFATRIDSPEGNDLVPACPSSPPPGSFRSPSGSKTMRSTPQRNNFRTGFAALFSASFEPSFCVPEPLWPEGRQALVRGPSRPAEWSIQEPLWERPAGPKLTRAEQVGS